MGDGACLLPVGTHHPIPSPFSALAAAASLLVFARSCAQITGSSLLVSWLFGGREGRWKSTESGHFLLPCHPLPCKGFSWASPKGLVCLGRGSEVRWCSVGRNPAGSRGQGMGTGKVALRRAQPQTKALSDHFPQAPKYLSFQVCVQRAGLRECHARSQQTAGAAGVVFGGRRSTKESEQTSLQRRLMPERGK